MGGDLYSQYKGLATELPANVRLLTLQYVTDTEILLRLEHQYEVREDKTLSVPATVNIEVCTTCSVLFYHNPLTMEHMMSVLWLTHENAFTRPDNFAKMLVLKCSHNISHKEKKRLLCM